MAVVQDSRQMPPVLAAEVVVLAALETRRRLA
jgi:hypothetical protein